MDAFCLVVRGFPAPDGTPADAARELLGPAEFELRYRGERPPEDVPLPPGVTPLEPGEAGLRFRVEDPQEANPALLRAYMSRGVEVVALQELPRTLEQVYLAAMARVRHE